MKIFAGFLSLSFFHVNKIDLVELRAGRSLEGFCF